MKLKKLSLFGLLILPLVFGQAAFAQTSDADRPVSSQEPAAPDSQKTLAQRIAERKAKSQRKFTQVELNQVRFRCQAATGLIKSSQAKLGSFEAKRTKVYNSLVARLEKLSPKFKAAGADTTTYDQQVAQLKTKAVAYDTDMSALKLAVDDLAAMDCAADAEGFAVTLLEAVRLRASVVEQGRYFRAYLKDSLKPTFVEIRNQLNANNAKGEE